MPLAQTKKNYLSFLSLQAEKILENIKCSKHMRSFLRFYGEEEKMGLTKRINFLGVLMLFLINKISL